MLKTRANTAFALAFATLAAASVCTPRAWAQDMETTSVVVSTAGLDLATPAGAAILRQRLRDAAVQVCGDRDVRDLAANADYSACRSRALASAGMKANTLIGMRTLHTKEVLASASPN